MYNYLFDTFNWMCNRCLTLDMSLFELLTISPCMPRKSVSILLVAQAKPLRYLFPAPLLFMQPTTNPSLKSNTYRVWPLPTAVPCCWATTSSLHYCSNFQVSFHFLIAPLSSVLNIVDPVTCLKSHSDHVTLMLKSLNCSTFTK